MFEIFQNTKFLKAVFKDSTAIMTRNHTILASGVNQINRTLEKKAMQQDICRSHKQSLFLHVTW